MKFKHTKQTKRKLSNIAKLRLGDKASNWKGGRMIVDGYIYIHSPTHPNRTKDGYVCEHRLVMEKHIGRTLLPKEVVHHIDENRKNNKIENLMLYSSTGKHSIDNHFRRDKYGRFSKL